MEIPQIKLDWLNQIATIQGIPVEDLKKYYLKQINDPTCVTAFPKEEDLLDYIDNLLATHIQEFHSAVMTTYEVVVFASSAIKTSKAGNAYNNHVMMARLPGEGNPFRWMNVINNEDTGVVEKILPLSSGTYNVNVKENEGANIVAFSRSNSTFTPKVIAGIPTVMSEKIEWMKKSLKSFTIATAGQNLSAKDKDGKYVNPCSLRWMRGTIATHRITKKIDEKTGIERSTGILNLSDASAVTIPDFGKSKTITDPKNPGKTITEYGGFSAFVDPEDIATIGKGSECIFIGTLTSAKMMNINTIIPLLTIAPKKATEKLQKSGSVTSTTPVGIIDASVNPVML
jgi:hypothetical protein